MPIGLDRCLLAGLPGWTRQKVIAPSLDPLDYRGLAILSKLYRLYFTIRLTDLRPWISTWEDPELYAGTTAATGAEDAWYLTALDFGL